MMHFAFCVLLLTSLAAAQSGTTAPPPDYSREALVIERLITRGTFQADGTSVRETSAVVHVQAEAGVQNLAVLRFQYGSANETVEVDYVRVRKPDGAVIATPPYNVQDMSADVTRLAPMYSDIHEKHVAVKALGVGDTLEYLVRYRTQKPQISGRFWLEYNFTKTAVVKDEELEITVPVGQYVKVSSPDLKPQIKDQGSTRTYLWKTANLVRKDTSDETPKRYEPNPSVQITTFRDWDEVGRWWSDLQKTQIVITPEIRAKAAELTKGLSSDEDRIRALYEFVSTRIHYISLSFGVGRYQPHPASEVLDNEYGDCKDKHTLLAALLKASGYDAWPALINATRRVDAEISSPAQFDHVITVVPRGQHWLWLDTTPEVAPAGYLLANLRGKQAFVIPEGKPASLQSTPANPPFPSLQLFTAEGKLGSDGVLTARVRQSTHGDAEVLFRLAFRQVQQAQWKDLVQRISYLSGFGGEVSAVTATAPSDTSKPFEFSYEYKRKDYSDWANRRITPPLPPFGIEAARDDDKKPTEPLFLGALGEVVYRAQVELPPGAKPSLPGKVDITDDFAEYHSSYKLDNNLLTAERRLVIKKSEVADASWEQYHKFRKAVADDENHYIDLNLPGESSAGRTGAAASPVDPELARLYEEGRDALEKRDLTTAEEDFQKILARDPKFPNAHGYAGLILSARQRTDEAIREILKEEEINPKELYWYRVLASVYVYLKREDEAIDQWRKLLQIDPKNRDVATRLGGALTDKKRYAEAVEVLEAATAQSPDSPTLQGLLGDAYLGTKQKDKAETVLKKAVELDPSRDTLNNAAFSAADGGVLPELSRQWAEKAVAQLENETAKTTLARLQADDVRRTALLAAYWDTLGWANFRSGDLRVAERYLHAAWVLDQYPRAGDHLGQVYEQQGKVKEAAHMYGLAFAANLNASDTDAAEHYKKLTGKSVEDSAAPKLARRGAKGTAPEPMWPGEELSRMRTLQVAPFTNKTVSAEFFVLVSPGPKVEEVKFISGSDELKAAGTRLSSMNFPVEFPDDHPVRIVRRGILMCGISGCDFTLLLPESVRSTN